MLSEDDDIVGLDIDHYIVDRVITDFAQSIITRFNSYTEVSPSGEGIRIFCRGHFPFSGRKTKLNLRSILLGDTPPLLQVYPEGLFEIVESQTALDWLVEQYLEAIPNSKVPYLNKPDKSIDEPEVSEFINRMHQIAEGNKFNVIQRRY